MNKLPVVYELLIVNIIIYSMKLKSLKIKKNMYI